MCHFPIVGTLLATAPAWAINTFIPSLTDMWNKRGVSLDGNLKWVLVLAC
jgi:hypothetical protein